MKNACLSLLVCISSAFLFSSCREDVISGTGSIGNDQRSTGSFTAIEIAVPLKASINVTAGAQASIKLSGYKNVLKYVKTEVKNNVLRIYTEPGVKLDDEEYLNADITVPSLTELVMEGAPDADVHGSITGQEFTLTISGSSDITIDEVNTTNFTTTVSGAGDIKVNKGNVQQASYTVSGAGDIKAYGLHSIETSATVSGAGDIQVFAEQKLNAEISGAGSVSYKGHPVVSSQTSGVGGVEDAN